MCVLIFKDFKNKVYHILNGVKKLFFPYGKNTNIHYSRNMLQNISPAKADTYFEKGKLTDA